MQNLTLSRFIIPKSPRSQLAVIIEKVYNTLLNQSTMDTLMNNKPVGEIVTWVLITSVDEPDKHIFSRVECDKLDKERITLTNLIEFIAREDEKLGGCEYVVLRFYYIISEDEFPKELLRNFFILADFEDSGIKEINVVEY